MKIENYKNKTVYLLMSYRFAQFAIGIIYLILSLISMKFIGKSIVFDIRIFGVFSTLKGMFEFLNYKNIKKRMVTRSEAVLVTGSIDVIVGMNFLFLTNWGFKNFVMIIGIWMFINSLLNLCTSKIIKEISKWLWWVIQTQYILCFLISIMTVFNINLISIRSQIGIYFLLFSIAKIIASIVNKRDLHSLYNIS